MVNFAFNMQATRDGTDCYGERQRSLVLSIADNTKNKKKKKKKKKRGERGLIGGKQRREGESSTGLHSPRL